MQHGTGSGAAAAQLLPPPLRSCLYTGIVQAASRGARGDWGAQLLLQGCEGLLRAEARHAVLQLAELLDKLLTEEIRA